MNAEDALEFIMAGAAAVQVGTASFIDPRATAELLVALKNSLLKKILILSAELPV
jgi:dihydroorotate dehydrogenase (NAD+) catalytic subunit